MDEYTFRIWFSGLCHFVPNRDLSARCQLCVVLPRASDMECTHLGRVHTVARYLECEKVRIRPGDKLLQELEDRRVVFKISRADDLPPLSPFEPVLPAGVIDLNQIAGPFVDENDTVVSVEPDPDNVSAQILFEGGYFTGFDNASVFRSWTLPATLTGGSTDVTIADPVYIEFSGVRKVEMIASPLYHGGEHEPQELTPNGSTIEILVSNRCFTDEKGEKPKKLTADDIECRFYDNGFRIVQIDKDFAFNYQMLHPTTLASLSKFLPKDPHTGQPRFPVPESDLLSVFSAFPFCLDDILVRLTELLEKPGKREVTDESAEKEKTAEIKALKIKLIHILLLLVPTGVGTGSGSDCLGASGLTRFVDLDNFIPLPGPAAATSSTPFAASLPASPESLASSRTGATSQVIRSKTSPVPARLRGQVSGPTNPSQADQPAPSANQPQVATKQRKP